MKKIILTCTTGRSGTVYLTDVLKSYALENVRIIHEEVQPYKIDGDLNVSVAPTESLESLCEEYDTLIVTGRIGMSVFAHEVPHLDPEKYDVKLLFLVRNMVDTSLSWLRYLARHQLGENYLYKIAGPYWWYGHNEIKFNPEWSNYQITIWHWFMTYLHGVELLCVKNKNTRCLPFNKLNDVSIMKDIIQWVLGSDIVCIESVLKRCKNDGRSHATVTTPIELDKIQEYSDWEYSLSYDERLKVQSLRDFQLGWEK